MIEHSVNGKVCLEASKKKAVNHFNPKSHRSIDPRVFFFVCFLFFYWFPHRASDPHSSAKGTITSGAVGD